MEVYKEGHVYFLDNLKSGNQALHFVRKDNECIEHGTPEEDGVLTQEVIRALIDRTEYLNNILPCEETSLALKSLRNAFFQFEARAWRRKRQGLNGKNKNHDITEVPFDFTDMLDLPIGPDGHVIPNIPKLEASVWYEHNSDNPLPSGPAAFMDPKDKISIMDAKEGLMEGIAIEDIVWNSCNSYRRFDPIDTSLPEFGMF